MLIGSGVSSSLERVLLAATQQRQSPANATLFGLANFLIDGIKLFAKSEGALNSFQSSVLGVGIIFTACILSDNVFSASVLGVTNISIPIFVLLLLPALELCTLLVLSGQGNHFVVLAGNRWADIFVLVEVSFGMLLLLLHLAGAMLGTSSLAATGSTLTLFVIGTLFVLWLVAGEKVPFDLVEAESELIDGVTVDLAGAAFSMVYAAESVAVWLSLKVFLVDIVGFVPLLLALLMVLAFFGRILVARVTYPELENFIWSIGLTVPLLSLCIAHVVVHSQAADVNEITVKN